MQTDHDRFMAMALDEAKRARDLGNPAAGSVIVRDGEILARGYNEVASSFDVTAHAEARALRNLTTLRRELNPTSQADSGPFAGAILYTTLEPCPMCCWLTCITGISTLVIGARHADLGIPYGAYTAEKLIALTERRIKVVTGVLTPECMAVCRSAPSFKAGPR
jgi:tRNA(adenine34) deaminase